MYFGIEARVRNAQVYGLLGLNLASPSGFLPLGLAEYCGPQSNGQALNSIGF